MSLPLVSGKTYMPDRVDSVVTCNVVVFRNLTVIALSDIFENEELVQQI